MFKIIRRIFLGLLLILIIAGVFQWNNYNKKVQSRENALLYFKEQDYVKAISYLEEGIDNISFFGKKLNYDMYSYLAECYYQMGQYEKAVNMCNKLISQDKKNDIYYMMKGDAYKKWKKSDKAVDTYKQGWNQTKKAEFLNRICDIYIADKDYDSALSYIEMGIEEEGEAKAGFMFDEIVIYEKSQNYQLAYETAKKYCKLFPEDKKGAKELVFLTTRIN